MAATNNSQATMTATPANLTLFDAVSNGDLEAALLALSFGADPNYCSSKGDGSPSVIHSSASSRNGNDEEAAACAAELIDHGAIVDATLVSNLNTPLHLAATSGKPSLCKVLLENGADPSASNSFGNTPLHSAVHSRSLDVVRLLLEHGAHATSQNHRGSTALHFAACLATNTDADTDTDNMLEIAQLLLQFGKADANAVDIHGHSALHVAAQRGCDDLVALLVCVGNGNLTLKTGVDAKGRGGRTARQMAVFGDQMGTAAMIERMEVLSDAFGCNTDGNTRPMRKILEYEAPAPLQASAV